MESMHPIPALALLIVAGCATAPPPLPCPTGDCRPDLVDLAVGDAFGCALAASGALQCWGRNAQGQLATGDFQEVSAASHVLADAVAVDAGERHACAVRVGGGVACWGENDRSQVSREPGDASAVRTVPVPEPAIGVSAGEGLSCAWTAAGAVWCWGEDVPTPRLVPGVTAAEVAVARRPCAREAAGDVVCWTRAGPVRWDARADALEMDGSRPVILRGAAVVRGTIDAEAGGVSEEVLGTLAGATDLAVANGIAYARAAGGEIAAFGLEQSPVINPVTQGALVAAGGLSACALTDRVQCWGVDAAGLRPTGTGRPTSIDRGGTVFAGGIRTCVAAPDEVRCHDVSGHRPVAGAPVDALAIGERGEYAVRAGVVEDWPKGGAVPVPADQVASGDNLVCGREDGDVVCWEPGRAPVRRPLRARAVAVGGRFACAVDGPGAVWCWEGLEGEARPITGLREATDVGVGTNLACATTSAGVWCWNHWRGAVAAPTSPVAAGLDGALQLAVGMEHACALDADGGVWCWGRNTAGQLGDGSRRGRTRAVKVPSLPAARRVDAGHSHSCAETTDGEVFCWGMSASFGLRQPYSRPTDLVDAPLGG